jgi:chromate transporter
MRDTRKRLGELAGLYLKLGATAFGGPALATLGRTAAKTRFLLALGLVALAASFVVHELLVLLAAGVVSACAMQFEDFLRRARGNGDAGDAAGASGDPRGEQAAEPHAPSKNSRPSFFPLLFSSAAISSSSFSLSSLFLVCLKIGAVLFGSGYVLLAYLRADLVERLHWLTNAQLLDAGAVGQFTPGPLLSSATFVGYLLAGPAGALAATAGIFLPAFAFVAACGPFVPRLRRSRLVGAFLDGVNAAALALMAGVTLALARPSLPNVPSTLLFAASAAVLAAFRPNAAWLVLAGGALGLAFG